MLLLGIPYQYLKDDKIENKCVTVGPTYNNELHGQQVAGSTRDFFFKNGAQYSFL